MKTALRIVARVVVLATFCTAAQASAPTHREAGALGGERNPGLRTPMALAMGADGNLLVADQAASAVLAFAPDGRHVATMKTPFGPTAMCVAADGEICIGGIGSLARLDKTGRVLAEARPGALAELPRTPVSGIAVDGKDVFASFASGTGTTRGLILRLDRDLTAAVAIGSGYRGCCGILDIAARDGVVCLAENGGFRVILFDRNGKETGRFGKRDASSPDGFGGCCNPMNLCFGPDGALWTSEKTPNVVKRFDLKGKLLSVVGTLGQPVTREDMVGGCVSSSIAISPDGNTVYVLDKLTSSVRVLRRKG